MKRIDELVNDACVGELEKLSPQAVDEAKVLSLTLQKLDTAESTVVREKPLPFDMAKNPGFEELDHDLFVPAEPEPRRGARRIVTALAACLALVAAAGLLFRGIPLLTELTAAWQSEKTVTAEGEKQDRLQGLMSPVESEVTSAPSDSPFTASVKKVYYDGKFLACDIELATGLDPDDGDIDWRTDAKVNGSQWELQTAAVWTETGEGLYRARQIFVDRTGSSVPETPTDAQVSLTVSADRWMSEDLLEHVGETVCGFTASCTPENLTEVTGSTKLEGVQFVSLSVSPAGTEIVLDGEPEWIEPNGEGSGHLKITLADENGKSLPMAEGRTSVLRDRPGGMIRWFACAQPLPQDVRRVTVKAARETGEWNWGAENLLAAFDVDLETREARLSQKAYVESMGNLNGREFSVSATWPVLLESGELRFEVYVNTALEPEEMEEAGAEITLQIMGGEEYGDQGFTSETLHWDGLACGMEPTEILIPLPAEFLMGPERQVECNIDVNYSAAEKSAGEEPGRVYSGGGSYGYSFTCGGEE